MTHQDSSGFSPKKKHIPNSKHTFLMATTQQGSITQQWSEAAELITNLISTAESSAQRPRSTGSREARTQVKNEPNKGGSLDCCYTNPKSVIATERNFSFFPFCCLHYTLEAGLFVSSVRSGCSITRLICTSFTPHKHFVSAGDKAQHQSL